MNFIILGAGPGLPNAENNLSSLVIQTSGGNFLADCGDGTYKQLLQKGFSGDYLDAILISHYHPDHVAGLYMVLQMLYLEGRTKPLDLFLPERPAAFLDTLHMFYTFEQRFAFNLKVHEIIDAELVYPGVSVALTDHLLGYESVIAKYQYSNLMQSYSFVFDDKNKTLIYTSDLGTFTNIEALLQSADTVVMDALHPPADLIIDFILKNNNRIILTHGISDKLKHWLQENPQSQVELAQEGILYQL